MKSKLNLKSKLKLNKLKSAAKDKTRPILRKNKKNVEDEQLQHELFLTIRQTTKIRYAFCNNMSTDSKVNEMIQPDEFLCNMLGNLDKK